MSDQLLNTVKIGLLGLLYLFFARVLWAVWTEVRVPSAPGLVAGRVKNPSASRSRKKAGTTTPSRLLMVEPPSMRGSTVSLDDEIVVGRSADCDVSLPDDPFVSTRHARFFRNGDEWFVEDLGSTNGTLLNAVHVTTGHVVRIDDRIQTGSAVFEVN